MHGANALSRRHLRTLLCDGCNLRPAAVRCPVEKNVALCQSCDWDSHGSSSSSSCSPLPSQHRRHALECFSGCPSAAELGSLWECDLVSVGRSAAAAAAAAPNLAGFNNGSGKWGGKSGASDCQISAVPNRASDAWGSSSVAQRSESSVPDVRASPGKIAAFAAMSGAGPPLLAKVQTSLPDSQLHGPSFFKQGSAQWEPQWMAAPTSGSWGFIHDPREIKP